MNLPTADELRARARRVLEATGAKVDLGEPSGHGLPASTPITGEVLFTVPHTTPQQVDRAIADAAQAFSAWRGTPAPVRGALVARLGELLTQHKNDLATLITFEVGKITSEALGEVQEMIDVCQFAVGLSRQLYGRTIASERPGHRLLETWHPLGVVGVITAFNFPVAVWAWNAAVALVCGDTVVWKPSELTPLTALACQALIGRAAADVGAPPAVSGLVLGDRNLGEQLVDDPRVALVSATGSVRMGQAVGPRVAGRFGRVLLEVGRQQRGHRDAIGRPGPGRARDCVRRRRHRRAALHQPAPADRPSLRGRRGGGARRRRLQAAAHRRSVGPGHAGRAAHPRDRLPRHGGRSGTGARRRRRGHRRRPPAPRRLGPSVCLLRHTRRGPHARADRHRGNRNVRADPLRPNLRRPGRGDSAQQWGAARPSSAIFTTDLREAERFLDGSDCGIANVNIGTSGAEIGGAFGGEKQTGGGRESGSDAWKAYMRRATNTVNYSSELPLAQGVEFG